jgi:hypothetical protein
MSTITSNHFALPLQWSKDHLVNAQKQFNREPTATHWNVCTRAMLTYQQLRHAVNSASVDKTKLSRELEESPLGDWQDIICLNVLGMFCADALNKA